MIHYCYSPYRSREGMDHGNSVTVLHRNSSNHTFAFELRIDRPSYLSTCYNLIPLKRVKSVFQRQHFDNSSSAIDLFSPICITAFRTPSPSLPHSSCASRSEFTPFHGDQLASKSYAQHSSYGTGHFRPLHPAIATAVSLKGGTSITPSDRTALQ